MHKQIKKFAQAAFILLFVLSMAKPQPVYAQEGTTQTPDPAAVASTDATTVIDVPTSEPVDTQTDVPVVTETVVPESTQAPATTPTDLATILQTTLATIIGDSTATETATATSEPLSNVVSMLDGANATLVDASGNPISLATVEAEKALTGADPWFVDSTDPTHVVAYFASQAGCDGWSQPAGYSTYDCFVDAAPIQAAINSDLSTNSTINLAGTFTETVKITKNITLDGGGNTVIAPTAIPTTNGVGSDLGTIFVDGTAAYGNIYVTIKNLTIDGSNVTNPFGVDGFTFSGILFNNANVILLDNAIKNFLSSQGIDAAAVVINNSHAQLNGNSFTNNSIAVAVNDGSKTTGANNVFTYNAVRVTITQNATVDLGLSNVYTDKDDYAPGSIVTFSGDNGSNAGYIPGEAVHVDVSGPNGYVGACAAVVNGMGAWSCQIILWSDARAKGDYSFTATSASGIFYSGKFSDSNSTISGTVRDSVTDVTHKGEKSE